MFAGRALCAFLTALCLTLVGCGGSGGSSAAAGADFGKSAGDTAMSTTASPAAGANAGTDVSTISQQAAGVQARFQLQEKVSTGGDRAADPMKSRAKADAPVPAHVVLPAYAGKHPSAQKGAAAGLGVPTQVGVARAIGDTASAQQVAGLMGWSPTARGAKVGALRFVSTGAQGVRLGLLVRSLPLGSVVRFHADGADTAYEATAQTILAIIRKNIDAGDASDAGRTFWAPNLGGEAITVEIEVPSGTPTDAVQVAVPVLSHVLVNINEQRALQKPGDAGTCNLDVSCNAEASQLGKSVALMDFVVGGSGFLCTGTLLNDIAGSSTPYFLGANHCISNQTAASTLRTRWFFKSTTCNSTSVNSGATWLESGATLLYASDQTDTSFLRLNAAPPAGAVYAAWNASAIAPSAPVLGVHHPRGDLQKYSTGTSPGPAGTCGGTACGVSESSRFLRVWWTGGTTEPGSSGSGLFAKSGTTNVLVGQLYGGNASCSTPELPDYFGRFDIAYGAALSVWLAAPPVGGRTPIYRFYNNRTAAHFYTRSASERDDVVAKYPWFTYEGIGFYANGSAGADGADAVYRMYNTRTGAHFYTVSAAERQEVLTKYSWFTDEGISWYGSAPRAGTAPMYRFYNQNTRSHFYTIDPAERDHIVQSWPQLLLEGVAYYAWTSP